MLIPTRRVQQLCGLGEGRRDRSGPSGGQFNKNEGSVRPLGDPEERIGGRPDGVGPRSFGTTGTGVDDDARCFQVLGQ
jgi:hypothetical protein